MTREVWPELSLDATNAQFYRTVINDPVRGSQVVNLNAAQGATVGTGAATLSGGADGLATLQFEHFIGDQSPPGTSWGLAALDSVTEVALVAIPNAVNHPATAAAGELPPRLSPDETYTRYNALLVSCAGHRRFALLDEPCAQDLPADALCWAKRLQQGSTAAASGSLTYPWLLGTDPLGEAGAVLAMPG